MDVSSSPKQLILKVYQQTFEPKHILIAKEYFDDDSSPSFTTNKVLLETAQSFLVIYKYCLYATCA